MESKVSSLGVGNTKDMSREYEKRSLLMEDNLAKSKPENKLDPSLRSGTTAAGLVAAWTAEDTSDLVSWGME